MKRLYLILTITLVLPALCAPVFAQVATVLCGGTACGGPGPQAYKYQVVITGGQMICLDVAVSDLNMANYANFTIPGGWRAVMGPGGPYIQGVFNPHGVVHAGPIWQSVGFLHFSGGPPIAAGTFAYDHQGDPQDSDWQIFFLNAGSQVANWQAPVGAGAGPVHAP